MTGRMKKGKKPDGVSGLEIVNQKRAVIKRAGKPDGQIVQVIIQNGMMLLKIKKTKEQGRMKMGIRQEKTIRKK